MTYCGDRKQLKIAIIGAGPAGLGTAIELAKLPFIQWDLYEKRSNLSEIGGGFTLQPQTWRILEHNGVAKDLCAQDYYRSAEGLVEQRRNGRTGELLIEKCNPEDVPASRHSCRLARAKLQRAMMNSVDESHIYLSKRLVDFEHLPDNRVRILIEDGTIDDVDLLIAADGIRSLIRKTCFPQHTLRFNGQFVYRTIVSQDEASKIEGIPWAPVFWKHVSGLYVFTCPLGDNDFEVTARIRRPAGHQEPVSWGRPVDLEGVLPEYDDFCPPVREILRLAARGDTQEFALHSGPRLDHVVHHGNIAFIGDASHALLGNFGSGAGFALEDVFALTRVIQWAWMRGKQLVDALSLFDSIRSPHYGRLYQTIDKFANIKAALRTEGLLINDEIAERVRRISLASESWMFYYDIDKAVEKVLQDTNATNAGSETAETPQRAISSEGNCLGQLDQTVTDTREPYGMGFSV
ncbi:uncharacterized protein E0L32_008617 [Thyridium curvatum]|uniref:FAD-binding domain-containing protein n=1 Tax=Thyridium curvatum TaxID=1093900 RepID=A0A507B089_9PEZI|nr:uncharacterized protein E0L32_008617 [Thyridium curvatum]TPX10398.1 hypothetical protein E0L32_008617 [Thyridium curvatum]